MTITRYDGFAIIPKRCDYCHRLFWLESYDVVFERVGIEDYPLKQVLCRECDKRADERREE